MMPGSEQWLQSQNPDTFAETDYYAQIAKDYGFTIKQLKSVLDTPRGRRLAVQGRPLLFALLYHRNSLVLRAGKHAGQVTHSTVSLDFFNHLHEWSRPNDEPGQRRIMLASPRESGKSLLLAQIGPAYTLVTSPNPEFIMILTASHTKAKERMASIRSLLSRVSKDYPHLAPARRGSYVESNTMLRLKMANGSVIMAASIGSSDLAGALDETLRPSLIILDDISPAGGEWSTVEDAKRLRTIREVVLELGKLARSWWVGTTTAYGSLVHQALQAHYAKSKTHWSFTDKWDIRHHSPLYTVVHKDGSIEELSFWSKLYSAAWLQSERDRDDRLWSLNWNNTPQSAGDGSWWNKELFVHDGDFPPASYTVISVDPGISKTGDPCGISVVSFSHALRKACVHEVFELPAQSIDIKRTIMNLKAKYPQTTHLVWESNAGGEQYCFSVVGHDFEIITGVKVVLKQMTRADGDKVDRARILLGRYKSQQIVHERQFTEYEDELLSMPFYLRSPNMTDCVGMAIAFLAQVQIGPSNESTLAMSNRSLRS